MDLLLDGRGLIPSVEIELRTYAIAAQSIGDGWTDDWGG